jgi:hypothetical protein
LLEADVEEELRVGVELLDGECLKLTVPNRVGPTDRLVLMPRGRIVFVELKKPKGRVAPWQNRFHERMRVLGFRVEVLWTKEQVRAFFPTLRNMSSHQSREMAE